MKKLVFLFCFFVSFAASSQITYDTLDARRLAYDTTITISLPDKLGFQRTATFKGFFYNLEMQTLALRWRIAYFKDGEPVSLFGKQFEDKEQIANAATYVDMLGNVIPDTTGHSGPFISEIDFYKLIANRGTGANNATINQLIIQAGLRPGRWKE